MTSEKKMCKNNFKSKTIQIQARAATTLIELMIVVGIMTIVVGSITAFLIMSDNSWEIGRNKLVEQQQARNAMSDIAGALQYSSPDWTDSLGNSYPVSLSSGRIDFYMPVFYSSCCPNNCADSSVCLGSGGATHDGGDIATLTKITYKIDPSDSSKLLKKQGIGSEAIVANDINTVAFSCGCSGCSVVNDACPFVDIIITTQRENPYSLRSKIALRNQNITLSSDAEIEEPQEGEF